MWMKLWHALIAAGGGATGALAVAGGVYLAARFIVWAGFLAVFAGVLVPTVWWFGKNVRDIFRGPAMTTPERLADEQQKLEKLKLEESMRNAQD